MLRLRRRLYKSTLPCLLPAHDLANRGAHDSHEDPDKDANNKDAYKDAHVDPDEDAVALPHAATLTTLQDVLQRQVQGSV